MPARTASLIASWVSAGWSTALTATRAADWINYDRVALSRSYTSSDGDGATRGDRVAFAELLAPLRRRHALRLSASRDVGRGLELLLIGDNLLGGQLGEPDNLTIRQGTHHHRRVARVVLTRGVTRRCGTCWLCAACTG